jgi:hypothetical protein
MRADRKILISFLKPAYQFYPFLKFFHLNFSKNYLDANPSHHDLCNKRVDSKFCGRMYYEKECIFSVVGLKSHATTYNLQECQRMSKI